MTSALARRGGRGVYRRRDGLQPDSGGKRRSLPEFLEAAEVEVLLQCAPSPQARLLILLQWRSGLRISEALALDPADLSLESDRPTLRVRRGKGAKPRVVPVHPELAAAFSSALAFGTVGPGPIVQASRSTAWRWVQQAAKRAAELGAWSPKRRVGTHTLRHSYARHLLLNGIPINYVSRWLGHSSIQTTLVYLELVPDPTGSLSAVP